MNDDELRRAAIAARDAMLSSLPEPEDCEHDFSPAFEKKMRPLLRRSQHPVLYRAARQAAACFLALLVLSGVWLGVDTEARAAFFRWVREVLPTQIVYQFAGQPTACGVYRPAWVPEGYEEVDSWEGIVIYVNAQGKNLSLQYGPMQEGSALYVTDTDKTVLTSVDVNGIPGEFYLSTDPHISNSLLWLDEDAGMFFTISGFPEEDDILHMAESVYLLTSTN